MISRPLCVIGITGARSPPTWETCATRPPRCQPRTVFAQCHTAKQPQVDDLRLLQRVELRGIEPLTFSVPVGWTTSGNCGLSSVGWNVILNRLDANFERLMTTEDSFGCW